MIIDVTDQNKINKFYRLLPFYRSTFMKKVKFEMIGKDQEVKKIIKALNIKKRKERNKFVYLSACNEIDKRLTGKNICQFENNQCLVQRINKYDRCDGCCGYENCVIPHEKGCETNNLACKLFYCKTMRKQFDIPKAKDLKILKALNFRRQIIAQTSYFMSTENALKNVNRGSILYIILRDSFIDIKNLIGGIIK